MAKIKVACFFLGHGVYCCKCWYVICVVVSVDVVGVVGSGGGLVVVVVFGINPL